MYVSNFVFWKLNKKVFFWIFFWGFPNSKEIVFGPWVLGQPVCGYIAALNV